MGYLNDVQKDSVITPVDRHSQSMDAFKRNVGIVWEQISTPFKVTYDWLSEPGAGLARPGALAGESIGNTPWTASAEFRNRGRPGRGTVTPTTVDPTTVAPGKHNPPKWNGRVAQTVGSAPLDAIAQMEADRAEMQARRNSAISAAGRGAGAGYNAAINRLDDELAKAKEQLGRVGPLFDQKSANQKLIWNNADTELSVAADEALEKMVEINTQTFNGLREVWSDSQASASDLLGRIGADEATRAAVAEEVGRFEDTIMDMNEVDAQGRAGILQASEDLAVASAKAVGASSQLELVRNRIQIEADFKENIEQMLADKQQQIAARNAAVSAARQLEAARWPADQPFDRGGFANQATEMALKKLMGSAPPMVQDQVRAILVLFSGAGVKQSQIPKMLAFDRTSGALTEQAQRLFTQYGLDPAIVTGVSSNVLSWSRRVLPAAMDTWSSSAYWFDQNVANQNPASLPAGSAIQGMAYTARSGIYDPEDAMHAGRFYADQAEAGGDLSQLNDLMSQTRSPTTGLSYDDLIARNRQRAGLS